MTMTKDPSAEFTPKDNPAFILHGALSTSYGTVCRRSLQSLTM